MSQHDIALRSYRRLKWTLAFVQSYLAEVERFARTPRHAPTSGESPVGDAQIAEAFEAWIAPWASDRHFEGGRTLFRVVLGTPLRHAFKDHVALLATRYGERSNAR